MAGVLLPVLLHIPLKLWFSLLSPSLNSKTNASLHVTCIPATCKQSKGAVTLAALFGVVDVWAEKLLIQGCASKLAEQAFGSMTVQVPILMGSQAHKQEHALQSYITEGTTPACTGLVSFTPSKWMAAWMCGTTFTSKMTRLCR